MIGLTAKSVLRASRREVRPPETVCPLCIQGDHIAGANHIPHIIVEFCQPHHRWLTEQRLATGTEMEMQAHSIKSVEMALRSLAVTARALASALQKLCDALEFCAEKLRRAACKPKR